VFDVAYEGRGGVRHSASEASGCLVSPARTAGGLGF
jgi:hypothetical protein